MCASAPKALRAGEICLRRGALPLSASAASVASCDDLRQEPRESALAHSSVTDLRLG